MVHLFFRVSGIVLCKIVFICFAVVVIYVRCWCGILHFIVNVLWVWVHYC
jgi:hypothetical protein